MDEKNYQARRNIAQKCFMRLCENVSALMRVRTLLGDLVTRIAFELLGAVKAHSA